MKRFLVLVVCLGALSCSGGGGNSPTAPALPQCQVNNTAQVTFQDRSASNRTYDVIWDGSRLTTVAPSQTSSAFTVAAGTQHTLVFKFTNTNVDACTPSTPTLSQCSSETYWCTS